MIKTFFFFCMLVPIFGIGQVDTLNVEGTKVGKSYLSEVLITKSSNLGVFEIHYLKGRLSKSLYYVIDFKERKILSTFGTKSWRYLYSSWIDRNSILHLSKGGLFPKKVLYDLKSGNKIARKDPRSKEGQTKDASNDVHINSQELYCTKNIVYWGNLRIYYDGDLNCFIVDNE